ncbi:hypothetical protein FJT64_023612 [Amphibalanus amphitrite]|uniref:ZP domain-containing protein n=1 Tax=Amphibalanus amphitrite TaxID=1232801 RepID=A0A6A4WR62_AMPAM|nr:hypothetical protein FJT64_023612 [Amphibalanus amphitrite]
MLPRKRLFALLVVLQAVQVRAQFDMGTFKVVTGRMSRDMTTVAPDASSSPPQTVPTASASTATAVETVTEPGAATVELRTTTRIAELLDTVEDSLLPARTAGGNPGAALLPRAGRPADDPPELYSGRSSWDRIREVRRRSMNMTRVERYAYDPGCIYINGTGRNVYEFLIQLNRCGTLGGNNKRDVEAQGRDIAGKNFMWNTVSVQYNSMIEEEWDEHFKVTCEYGYDIWKTVTFPFLDVETQTGNPVVFTLSPPECYMEIRYGYGTTGNRITGPVRVGDPLTLIIYMRSQYDGFDIVVSDCYAHNGADKKISLVDHYGCPVDEKLISPFQGTFSEDGVFETQVYAYMKTFRFTGSPALYIECDVRMCHGACPTQPCHWRRGKRSVPELDTAENKTAEEAQRTQSLALFQALQVLKDDEELERTRSDSSGRPLEADSVCLSSGVLLAAAGVGAFVVLASALACCLFCRRLRRQRKEDEVVETFRPPRMVRPSRLP